MTSDQTAYVLKVLCTAYPEFHMTPHGAVLWAAKLEPFDFDDVDAAADQWIVSNERFPHISQIIAGARTAIRERREGENLDRMLGQGPQTAGERAQVAKIIATTRQLLADQKKKVHWHGGPDPCEVCGGMKGTLGKLDQRQVEDGVA